MKRLRGPIRAIPTATIAAIFLLAACGSEADSAFDDTADTTSVVEADTTSEVHRVTSTTAGSEPESNLEIEARSVPEDTIAAFTAAFGIGDADQAWSFVSDRCQGGISEAPASYQDAVADYALAFPGATAENITAVVDGDRAAMSYDVYDGSGTFAESYTAQPWVLSEGSWFRDHC